MSLQLDCFQAGQELFWVKFLVSLRLIHDRQKRKGHHDCTFLSIMELYGQIISAPYVFYWILNFVHLFLWCTHYSVAFRHSRSWYYPILQVTLVVHIVAASQIGVRTGVEAAPMHIIASVLVLRASLVCRRSCRWRCTCRSCSAAVRITGVSDPRGGGGE